MLMGNLLDERDGVRARQVCTTCPARATIRKESPVCRTNRRTISGHHVDTLEDGP